jgi:hypothetical protein
VYLVQSHQVGDQGEVLAVVSFRGAEVLVLPVRPPDHNRRALHVTAHAGRSALRAVQGRGDLHRLGEQPDDYRQGQGATGPADAHRE